MLSALNMELESVRTVFRNEVNDASVFIDKKRDSGVYYTVLSIFDKEISKDIVFRMSVSGLFSKNSDFIGSFSDKDALCLVFVYHPENRLLQREKININNFPKRRDMVLSLITEIAKTELTGDIGRLMLNEININISPDGDVYLNYFLDFSRLRQPRQDGAFFYELSSYVFELLSRDFEQRLNGEIERYPNELRLMYKKVTSRAFTSFNQLITFVKSLPDTLRVRRTGLARILDLFTSCYKYIVGKPMNVFILIIVTVTLVFLVYQLSVRAVYTRRTRENTFYSGMEMIGNVYLGEENI